VQGKRLDHKLVIPLLHRGSVLHLVAKHPMRRFVLGDAGVKQHRTFVAAMFAKPALPDVNEGLHQEMGVRLRMRLRGAMKMR
jgi:hypothetical protein